MDSSRRLAYGAFGSAAVVAVGAVLGNLLLGGSGQSSPRSIDGIAATAVSANSSSCADLPQSVPAGPHVFSVTNTSIDPVSVMLTDLAGSAYAELESVAPQSTRSIQTVLGGGTYEFRCYFGSTPEISSAAFVVHGSAVSVPAVRPVSAQDLTGPALQYENWVAGRIPALVDDVGALAAAGTIDQQRAAWIAAHHEYETLGAAYDAFGDWDKKISTDGLHAIEQSLWSAAPFVPAGLEHQLVVDVDGLRADFPKLAISPQDIGLRAHEIVENTIEFTLSGRDDHGSHAWLDTASANLDGTERVLDVLRPLLSTRYPQLPATDAALHRAHGVVDEFAAKYPAAPLSAIAQTDRERLDSSFGGLVELLAPIAAITDMRRDP